MTYQAADAQYSAACFLRSQKSNRWFNYPDISGFLGRPNGQPLVTPAGRYLNSTAAWLTLLFDYTTVTTAARQWKSSLHFLRPGFPLKNEGRVFPTLFAEERSVISQSLNLVRLGWTALWTRRDAAGAGVPAGRGTESAGALRCPLALRRRPLRGCPLRGRAAGGSEVQPRSLHTWTCHSCDRPALAQRTAECVPGGGDLDH